MPSFPVVAAAILLGLPVLLPAALPAAFEQQPAQQQPGQEQPANKPETVAPAPALPSHAPIPASEAGRPNPIHPTAESQARAKRIYTIDCAMCHGADGSGKGDVATTAKMLNYGNPASLKPLSDGEIYYIIESGRGEMPPEGSRAKPDEIWNLVVYLRSLGKKNTGSP